MYNEDYLIHFNPFHDSRNGQFTSGGSASARQYRKALNKITKNEIKNKSIKYKNEEAVKRIEKKIAKDKRHDPSELSAKYANKINKHTDAAAQASKSIAQGRRLANSIMKDASEHGYTVKSKTVLRNANAGKHMAMRALAATADALTGYRSSFGRAARIGSIAGMDIVDARKYSVKRQK